MPRSDKPVSVQEALGKALTYGAMADTQPNLTDFLELIARLEAYNGTTWDRVRNGQPAEAQAQTAFNLLVSAINSLWNGATWDRQQNNQGITALASAARTASTNSADQLNYNAKGLIAVLDITAASGTGGLQLVVQGKDPISGNYAQLTVTPTAILAAGTYAYELHPGSSTAAPGAGNGLLQVRTAGALPRTYRIRVIHGDASSYTYSVGLQTIL